MRSVLRRKGIALAVCALGILGLAGSAFAAGFAIYEQGSTAMGLGGAFTAQADDPSAMFFNAAGLAFQSQRRFMLGTVYITSRADQFKGGNPFPGSAATGQLSPLKEFPSHFYYVQPVNERLVFGFGFNTPFGLTTDWENKSSFPGRYLSTHAGLRTFDLDPTLAWKATEHFSIGVGVIARFSDVKLQRYVPQINPFTQHVVDVGRVDLTSDLDRGYGWNVGILHKYNDVFSWGLSYRSKIKLDYNGKARFTQISTGIPQFDALVAHAIPFDSNLPVTTAIEYPDEASLGVAFALGPNLKIEADANWTGWSSFKELTINFSNNPAFDSVVPENWQNVYNYRLGLRWKASKTCEWRFGYVYDETPQPSAGVGPLLPDGNRNGFSFGYGHLGEKFNVDLAFLYLPFQKRTITNSIDNFNGTYKNTAYLFGATLSF